MIRVLHIIGTLSTGGMESVVLNLYRHIDTAKVQFDFVVCAHNGWAENYADEIRQRGGRIYEIPTTIRGFIAFNKLLRNNPSYKVVHAHRNAMSAIYLFIAWLAGIKNRISHCHSTNVENWKKKVGTFFLRPFLLLLSTRRMACGEESGEFLYGRNHYEILKNSIDISKYVYNEKIRELRRREFGLSPQTHLFGHVGRFVTVKNHSFLMKVFSEIVKKDDNARLLLIGSGELKNNIVNQSREYELEDKVIFLENRVDVAELLQMIDVAIVPSLYEGFSMAMVEMQATGMNIIASSSIPNEINITGNVFFKSLKTSPEEWAKDAIRLLDYNRAGNDISKLYSQGLDIHTTAGKVQKMYLDISVE